MKSIFGRMIDVGRFDATFGTSDANTAVGVAL
jgi:hypothetical protein